MVMVVMRVILVFAVASGLMATAVDGLLCQYFQ
jgi:hypothetical protein